MTREVWVVVPSGLYPVLNRDKSCLIWQYHVQDDKAMTRATAWFSSKEEAEVKCAVAGAEFKKLSLAAQYDHVFLRKFAHNDLS